MAIKCCKDCVPPKRQPGCHSVCEEYIKEKAEYEKKKAEFKNYVTPYLSIRDFEKIRFAGAKNFKHKRRL